MKWASYLWATRMWRLRIQFWTLFWNRPTLVLPLPSRYESVNTLYERETGRKFPDIWIQVCPVGCDVFSEAWQKMFWVISFSTTNRGGWTDLLFVSRVLRNAHIWFWWACWSWSVKSCWIFRLCICCWRVISRSLVWVFSACNSTTETMVANTEENWLARSKDRKNSTERVKKSKKWIWNASTNPWIQQLVSAAYTGRGVWWWGFLTES